MYLQVLAFMRNRALHPRQQTPVICMGSNAPCRAHAAAALPFLGLVQHAATPCNHSSCASRAAVAGSDGQAPGRSRTLVVLVVFVTLAYMRGRCSRACSDASSDHTSTAYVYFQGVDGHPLTVT